MAGKTTQNKVIIRPTGTKVYRRQRIRCQSSGNISEIAGSTAAELTAVCCCCPCTVVNMAVFAVYKVPAGLCKKALRRRRLRQMMRKGMLKTLTRGKNHENDKFSGWDDEDLSMLSGLSENEEVTVVVMGGSEMDKEFVDFEKEMWEKFDGGGFWRNDSHEEEILKA